MIYKFKSKATGDLIMLGPNGDDLLRVLGREPSAKGIIEPQDMVQAIAAIETAVADDEVLRQAAAAAPADDAADTTSTPAHNSVGLRQRLWPMHEMLKRASAAQEPVVWGV